jgi:hypothetical protein
MEWTSSGIQIWFFPRNAIPLSISTATGDVGPDPSTFGVPVANFQGDCAFDSHFTDHRVLFDTDFCGTYAGSTWQEQGCAMIDPLNVGLAPNVILLHWLTLTSRAGNPVMIGSRPIPAPSRTLTGKPTTCISTRQLWAIQQAQAHRLLLSYQPSA